MEIRHKHIGWWLCSMLMLLCWSCGGQDTDTDTPDVEQGPFLEIKVYSPERSQVTRADIGDIPGDKDENAIKNLNIWVFEHHGTDQTDDGKFVGYLSVTNLNDDTSVLYLIVITLEKPGTVPRGPTMPASLSGVPSMRAPSSPSFLLYPPCRYKYYFIISSSKKKQKAPAQTYL